MIILWIDGRQWTQRTPFRWETEDWNCDGDIYSEYGATFECTNNGDCFYNNVGQKNWFSKSDIEYYQELEKGND